MTGEVLALLSVSLAHPCRGRGREGAETRKAFGEISERGCAIVMNFSSGLKCNCNAGISALGSCLAVAVGCFLGIGAQRVKAKVGCAALGGENQQSEGVRSGLRGRSGRIFNNPGVRLTAADFEPSAMLSLLLLVGPVLHQDVAAHHGSSRAPRGEKGHVALLPALTMSFVTAGAGWEWGVPREHGTVGWSLGACLCLSQGCRLRGSHRAGFIQGAVPTPKSNPATQFWPIMLSLGLGKRPHLLKALEAVSLPVWCYRSSRRGVPPTGVQTKVSSSWGWKTWGDPMGIRM